MADVPTDSGPTPWLEVLLAEHEALNPSTPLRAGPDPAQRARLTGTDDGTPPLAALNSLVFRAGHSALCLSGGGIRSASFSVGVLQALARLGVLRRLDYLSTVSGGGFAGAWLTAWLYRARTDPAAARELEQLETGNRAADDIEPDPVLRLRRGIRYMSPREGMFSADAWTLGATMVRNLLLNWLVLLPLLAAALLVPRFQYAVVHLSDRDLTPGLTFGWADLETWVLLCAALMYAMSLAFVVRDLPSYGNARRSQRIFLARCLLPLCLGTLALTYFWAVDRVPLSLGLIIGISCAGHALIWMAVGFVSGRHAVRPRVWFAAALSAAVPATGLYWLTQVVFPNGVELHAVYVGTAFPLVLSFILLGTLVFIGTAGADFDVADLEWWSRFGAWVLIAATAWLVASAVVFGGPVVFSWARDALAQWLNLHEAHASALTGLVAPALGAIGALADTSVVGTRHPTCGPPDSAGALGPRLRGRAPCDAVVGRRTARARAVAFAGPGAGPVRVRRLPAWRGRARGSAQLSSGRRRLRGSRRARDRPARLRRRHGPGDPGQQVLARRDVPLPARASVSRGVARRAIAEPVHGFRSGGRFPDRGARGESGRCT